jgi:hypothetical protein
MSRPQWKRFWVNFVNTGSLCTSRREHEDGKPKTSKCTTCNCQRTLIPKKIRVRKDPIYNQFQSHNYCSDNELESLVGLTLLEDTCSADDDGNDIASTCSSLQYSDLGDDTLKDLACFGNEAFAKAENKKNLSCQNALIAQTNTVASTRITI